MARPESDDDFLKYSYEHVKYEIEMLFWLANILIDPSVSLIANSKDDKRRLNNALIEAFAIHYRNLFCFLFGKEVENGNNIVAEQYCSKKEWEIDRIDKGKKIFCERRRRFA